MGIADAADVHPEFRLMTAEVFALGICLLDDPFYEYKLLAESFTFKERTVTQWNVVRFPLYALWIQKATLYLQHIFRMTKISLFCVMPCFRVGKARCDIADDMTQRGHYKNSSLGRPFVQHRADAPEYEIKEESRWVERVFESWETSFRVIPPINEVYQVFCQNSQILVHRHIPCMGPDNDGEVFHNHADLNGGGICIW